MAIGANTLRNDPSVSHTKYSRRGKECSRSSFPVYLRLVALYALLFITCFSFSLQMRRETRKSFEKVKSKGRLSFLNVVMLGCS